jgi:hypothetical protein
VETKAKARTAGRVIVRRIIKERKESESGLSLNQTVFGLIIIKFIYLQNVPRMQSLTSHDYPSKSAWPDADSAN